MIDFSVHDTAKRPKLDPAKFRQVSSGSSGVSGGTWSSITGNGSEGLPGNDPPPSRPRRVNSTTSMSESQPSSAGPTPGSQGDPMDELMVSPRPMQYELNSPMDSTQHSAHRPTAWRDGARTAETGQTPHLPPLSDMLDDDAVRINGKSSQDLRPYGSGFVAANHHRPAPNGLPGSPPGRVPFLRHENPSTGSSGSANSGPNFVRSPGEGPLPIHALLSSRPSVSTPSSAAERSPLKSSAGSLSEPGKAPFGQLHGPKGYGMYCLLLSDLQELG